MLKHARAVVGSVSAMQDERTLIHYGDLRQM